MKHFFMSYQLMSLRKITHIILCSFCNYYKIQNKSRIVL